MTSATVWIRHASFPEDVFTRLAASASELLTDVIERARAKYTHWQLNVAQVQFLLLARAGEPVPLLPVMDAILALQTLKGTETLESQGVASGAWLLAVRSAPAAIMVPAANLGEGDITMCKLAELLERQAAWQERRERGAELRYINVRCWDGHTSALVKLRPSFAHFCVEALAAVRVVGKAQLCTALGNQWQLKQSLTLGTYAALLQQASSSALALPDVLVCELLPAGGEAPVGTLEASGEAWWQDLDEVASCNSCSEIDSQLYSLLLRRDSSACVLCSSTSCLEAARIIPQSAGQQLVDSAGLISVNYIANGMLLCAQCHRLHDCYMWCFTQAGVVVAEELLSDPSLGGTWRARVGQQLRRPDPASALLVQYWPPPSVWQAAFGLFQEDCEGRKVSATLYTPPAQRNHASSGREVGTVDGLHGLVEVEEREGGGAEDSEAWEEERKMAAVGGLGGGGVAGLPAALLLAGGGSTLGSTALCAPPTLSQPQAAALAQLARSVTESAALSMPLLSTVRGIPLTGAYLRSRRSGPGQPALQLAVELLLSELLHPASVLGAVAAVGQAGMAPGLLLLSSLRILQGGVGVRSARQLGALTAEQMLQWARPAGGGRFWRVHLQSQGGRPLKEGSHDRLVAATAMLAWAAHVVLS